MTIASNQDHVGYRLVAKTTCRAMLEELGRQATDGRAMPAIAFCPHRLEEPCEYRKPAPGLLTELARRHAIPPDEMLFVDNADSDHETAHRTGIHFCSAEAFFRRH